MSVITLNSVVSANEEIVTADMDEETVMMSITNGKYYNLGKTGSVIWRMLKNSISVDLLISNLLDEYKISSQQCTEEVLSFLNMINNEGLLKIE